MLEGVSAAVALAGLGVAIWLPVRAAVTLAAAVVAGVSLVVSGLAVGSAGGRADAFTFVEAVAMLALIFVAVRRTPRAEALIAGVLLGVAAPVMIVVETPAEDSLRDAAGGVAFWALAAIGVAGAARHLRTLELRRANAVAEARRRQRLELARDLHDFVAHDVSAIVVQAQAARLVADREPQEAPAALERIESDGLRALAALDRTVHALSEVNDAESGRTERATTRTHGLEELPELTERFAATGSVEVRLDLQDEPLRGLAPEVTTTGYRVVVEALTNVRRHARGARRVDVEVARVRDRGRPALAVTITNDGRLAGGAGKATLDAGDRPSGLGLAGLRDRIETLGGTVTAGPREQDLWQVKAVVPLPERAARAT